MIIGIRKEIRMGVEMDHLIALESLFSNSEGFISLGEKQECAAKDKIICHK